MSDSRPDTNAAGRLAILLGLAIVLAFFACRPAWSPDSRRLAFPLRLPDKALGVALFDRATGTTSLLPGFEATEQLPIVGWTATGDAVLVIREQPKSKQKIEVLRLPVADTEDAPSTKPRRFEVAAGGLASGLFAAPPVIIGRYLFFSTGEIKRLDLVSGEIESSPAPPGTSIAIARRGDGLCYVQLPQGSQPETGWEVGTLDPETFERTPLATAEKDAEWVPYALPSFSPDLERVVMPAHRAGGRQSRALIVVRDGKIETRLPLGAESNFGIGGVAWKSDGVTIVAGICRRNGEDQTDEFALLEMSFSGSFVRETPLFRTPLQKDDEAPAFLAPMALAPDRTIAAISTGLIADLPPERAGLYLVDLTQGQPKVERIPLPQPVK